MLRRIPSTALLFFFLLPSAFAADLIPIEKFGGLPDVDQIALSPDGHRLAAVVRSDVEGLRGHVITVSDMRTGKQKPLFHSDNETAFINWVRWANSDVLMVSARFGDRRHAIKTTETRLLVADVSEGKLRSILRSSYLKRYQHIPQFQDGIVDLLPDDPEHILLQLQTSCPAGKSVYKINLNTRRQKHVQSCRSHVDSWMTDRQHRIRVEVVRDDASVEITVRDENGEKVQRHWSYEVFDSRSVQPIGFDTDPNILYLRAYHEGRLALFKTDLRQEGDPRELVYADPHYDVEGSLIYSLLKKAVVGTTYSDEGGFTFWDEDYIALQEGLNSVLPDQNNLVIGLSEDERRYLLLSTGDQNAGTFYYGDRDAASLRPIAYRYDGLHSDLLSPKQPFRYKARDGLEIEAFLTLPRNAGDEQLPTIIFPHGGPISYDGGGYDYWTQFFASRGYAVLQMNFRGSSGYGHAFMQAGLKNWGLAMQDDVEDGARALIEEGIADADRLCIAGASYGGYAALMGAIRNPQLYRCVISFAGVSDLPRLVSSHRHYTNYEVVKKQIGSDRDSLEQRSPLNLADNLTVPVLLIHGDADRVVDVSQSRRLAEVLQDAEANVTYVELANGDHYLSSHDNRLATFRAMERFLGEHLPLEAMRSAAKDESLE